ncbi:MAG: penicillin-binding transpeptidase domain-containing protein [Hyphomicrobiales bacterium]|nr:penicillin-binding transpeptidase domain-containing protein [Hyphomicrobiales bacterium]
MRRLILLTLLTIFLAPSVRSNTANEILLGKYDALIGERKLAFTVGRDDANSAFAFNASTDKQVSPFSTFKILNTVIALENGVASGPDFALPYDAKRNPKYDWWPREWAQDQTLASAFKRSAVWYYQELARRIGEDRYRAAFKKYNFGNGDISGGVNQFWLSSSLKISPTQYRVFLQALREGEFGVSQRTIDVLDGISLIESADGHSLHGKTGAGPIERANTDDPLLAFKGKFGGWLVGWVTRPEKKPIYFALYCEGPDFASIAKFRSEMARRLLVDQGYLPLSLAPKP